MFSTFHLRMIAIVCMLIDHIALILFPDSVIALPCRLVGRLAFPLFVFLLYQGYLHTSDYGAYGMRLLRCACISQPIYMMVFGTFTLNVCFSLLFCLLFTRALDHFQEYPKRFAVVMAVCLLLSCFAEYGMYSIALILSYYLWHGNKWNLFFFCGLLCICMSWDYYGAAALALPLIVNYSGARGPKLPVSVTYGFYPAHLAILFAVGAVLVLTSAPV